MKTKLWAAIIMVALAFGFVLMKGRTQEDPVAAAEIEDGTPMAAVKLPAQLSGEAVMGKRAFDAVCVDCHGANAAGQQGVAPPLVHKTYEPGHHADMAFVLAVQRGVKAHHWPFGDMPPVKGLTRADVVNIIAYVRELQQENGIN
ncbi:c-type cytochrome [Aliiroseovarius crassostreae]|uniref:c-type cytochrome n=1 Tax=Aliiroseovarius crassostreae TaxID=154981 RepID=UPI00220FA911|nr:cytochrome c [Aliiroseovarius crassostreae]